MMGYRLVKRYYAESKPTLAEEKSDFFRFIIILAQLRLFFKKIGFIGLLSVWFYSLLNISCTEHNVW
ncbi:hypothetical protein PN36_30375 [Candidatus Thiomargarita nelsonii]|uniref:Uncharacterized protein n=1 Tax=Candidatus Thiomargarita nelsonii TaxID=1003181 RepID=A0A4E0RC04_9GAMM|nr:hypothetical protein PN36_30375 [Candidatus Thiomargarita nelsonii]